MKYAIGNYMPRAKAQMRAKAKGRQVTGGRSSSRTNVRDLKKISPFGRNDNACFFAFLASWRDKIR